MTDNPLRSGLADAQSPQVGASMNGRSYQEILAANMPTIEQKRTIV
jgi:hypothetical protein